jgi:hypothetical protein
MKNNRRRRSGGHHHKVGSGSIYYRAPEPKRKKERKPAAKTEPRYALPPDPPWLPPDYFARVFMLFLIAVSALSWYFIPYLACLWIPKDRETVDKLFFASLALTAVFLAVGVCWLTKRFSKNTAERLARIVGYVAPPIVVLNVVLWFIETVRRWRSRGLFQI